jgi:hypothetical protein
VGELLHDLPLQVARVGRDPKSRTILLRPQAGGREIAERLADASARLDERDFRCSGFIAWPKSIGGGIAVGCLFGTLFTSLSDELRQP